MYSVPFSDLINEANKCNLILASIQLNHLNETACINTSDVLRHRAMSYLMGDVLRQINKKDRKCPNRPQSCETINCIYMAGTR
jgi:hypothetical protein